MQNITIKPIKISILRRREIYIQFEGIPMMSNISKQAPLFQISVERNKGLIWLKENFSVDEKDVVTQEF
jgi:hypothetical protein